MEPIEKPYTIEVSGQLAPHVSYRDATMAHCVGNLIKLKFPDSAEIKITFRREGDARRAFEVIVEAMWSRNTPLRSLPRLDEEH